MSVKIYDGFYVEKTFATFHYISAVNDALRLKYQKVAEHKLAVWAAATAAYDYDRRSLGLPAFKPDSSPLSYAWLEYLDRSGKEEDPFNIGYSITYLAHPDGRIFVLPFAAHDEWADDLKTHPGFVSYPYWNNTDQPENVSDEEWQQRYQDWSEVYLSRELSETWGMKAVIVNPKSADGVTGFAARPEYLKTCVPSLEARAGKLAQDQIVAGCHAKTTHDVIGILHSMIPGGTLHEAFLAHRAAILAKLDPELDFAKLTK